MKKITVTINAKNLDTPFRRQKAKEAARALEKIVNAPRFKELILAMPDSHRVTESSKYRYTPNDQIYHMLATGKEEWNTEIDYEMDLIVDDYRSSWFYRSVIGYMVPGKPKIWVNTRHFDSAPLKSVVSNFLHEYSHTLGFRHSSADRDGSIPYYLNKVVDILWDEVIKKEDTQNKPRGFWSCRRLWYTLWLKKSCKWVSLED